MKTPKLYQWAKDGHPPVSTAFLGLVNIMELLKAYSIMHQTLKEVKADINIVGEVSKETLEKIISLLKELKS